MPGLDLGDLCANVRLLQRPFPRYGKQPSLDLCSSCARLPAQHTLMLCVTTTCCSFPAGPYGLTGSPSNSDQCGGNAPYGGIVYRAHHPCCVTASSTPHALRPRRRCPHTVWTALVCLVSSDMACSHLCARYPVQKSHLAVDTLPTAPIAEQPNQARSRAPTSTPQQPMAVVSMETRFRDLHVHRRYRLRHAATYSAQYVPSAVSSPDRLRMSFRWSGGASTPPGPRWYARFAAIRPVRNYAPLYRYTIRLWWCTCYQRHLVLYSPTKHVPAAPQAPWSTLWPWTSMVSCFGTYHDGGVTPSQP